MFYSLYRVALGYAIAALLAIPLGLLMGWSTRLLKIIRPLIEVMRPIPPLAWIPIAILWFGIGIIGLVIGILRLLGTLVASSGQSRWQLSETWPERILLGCGLALLFLFGLFPQWTRLLLASLPSVFERLGK